jgi:ABC-2 type transport system ATP-binding protein
LHTDHFVLDIARPLPAAPIIEGYGITLSADTVLDVAVPKSLGLNRLFQELSALHIEVLSLRNKSNRLEQLFLDLVQ